MVGSFQLLQQFLYILVILSRAHTHEKRLDDKGSRGLVLLIGYDSEPQQPIHRPLQRAAGAPYLLVNQHGNVVIDGECGSHIMMFTLKAS